VSCQWCFWRAEEGQRVLGHDVVSVVEGEEVYMMVAPVPMKENRASVIL